MWDFLTFKTFVTPGILLWCYYLGAVGIPVASYLFARWLLRRFPALAAARQGAATVSQALISGRNRLRLMVVAGAIFLCMEVMWRMMFETMLAYFQMREALIHLPQV